MRVIFMVLIDNFLIKKFIIGRLINYVYVFIGFFFVLILDKYLVIVVLIMSWGVGLNDRFIVIDSWFCY